MLCYDAMMVWYERTCLSQVLHMTGCTDRGYNAHSIVDCMLGYDADMMTVECSRGLQW